MSFWSNVTGNACGPQLDSIAPRTAASLVCKARLALLHRRWQEAAQLTSDHSVPPKWHRRVHTITRLMAQGAKVSFQVLQIPESTPVPPCTSPHESCGPTSSTCVRNNGAELYAKLWKPEDSQSCSCPSRHPHIWYMWPKQLSSAVVQQYTLTAACDSAQQGPGGTAQSCFKLNQVLAHHLLSRLMRKHAILV